MHTGACRGQRRASDPLELEVEVALCCLKWVVGAKLGSLQEQYMYLTTYLYFSL